MSSACGDELEDEALALLQRVRGVDKFTAKQEVRVREAEACRLAANKIMNAAAGGDDGSDAGAGAGGDARARLLLAMRLYTQGVSFVNTAQWEGEGRPAGPRAAAGDGQFAEEKRALFEEARAENAGLRRALYPLYCNRSLCYLRLGDAAEARRDAEEAVEAAGLLGAPSDFSAEKAHFRLAQASLALGDWEAAERAIGAVGERSAAVRAVREGARRARAAHERRRRADAAGLRRHFGPTPPPQAQGGGARAPADAPGASAGAGRSASASAPAPPGAPGGDGDGDVTFIRSLRDEMDEIDEEEEEARRREREEMYNAAIRAQRM